MEKDDSKHIVDVDFTEDVKYIKGKPLYCKTNEVAQLLEKILQQSVFGLLVLMTFLILKHLEELECLKKQILKS